MTSEIHMTLCPRRFQQRDGERERPGPLCRVARVTEAAPPPSAPLRPDTDPLRKLMQPRTMVRVIKSPS